MIERHVENEGLGGVVALCIAIFFADASWSAAIPTFPAFAQALGSSLTMIGLLASISSLSTLLSSIPLGGVSDAFGRRRVMLLGMACFVVTPLVYIASSAPLHLFPARVLLGVAMGSTFSIGFIYVTELAGSARRSLAQGLYMTSMGVGFTIGPLVGGFSAKAWGYLTSFYLSSGLGAAGLLTMVIALRSDPRNLTASGMRNEGHSLAGFRDVLTDPKIIAAGIANFFNSLLFNAVMTFFPLYGSLIGFDESQVGLSLTIRGLSSTVSRFPTGTATIRLGALRLITLGLVLSAVTLLLLPLSGDMLAIGLLLGVQGLAYGIYLTSGNIYIAEEAPTDKRGTAIGVYSTFSNISGIVSPVLLGAIAETWTFRGAFQTSGILALAGAALTLAIARNSARTVKQK